MEAFDLRDDLTGNSASGAANTIQFIAFSIGEQTYGVEITTVREIRAWNGATPLPNTRPYVRGVINMASGKDLTGEQSQMWMRRRVLFQAVAIILVILIIAVAGASSSH